MHVTVIGGVENDFPKRHMAPIIETKRVWSDEWEYDRELELVSCGVSAGSTQVPTCEIKRRYGSVKLPQADDFETLAPRNMDNWWVRVSFVDAQGVIPQFVGQIQDEAKFLNGTATNITGWQSWIVSGGLNILGKIDISEAYFLGAEDAVSKVGWLPDMNSHDKRGTIVGNRSSEKDPESDVYLYGGTSTWTHRQYAEMILRKFVQQEGGPTWKLAGQVDILDRMSTTIQFSNSMKAIEILQTLIPVRYGVDFKVNFTDTGFEVVVFALIAEDATVAGQTMPRNPNTVTVQRGEQYDLDTVQLVKSLRRRVDRIRVLGRRIVVCGSLYGPLVSESEDAPGLVGKWNSTLETQYRELVDADAGPTADEQRSREKFRAVFQQFGAPVDWDLDGGRWAVKCGLNGELSAEQGEFQNIIRSTLPWIPLKEGFDYSQSPAVDNNIAGHIADVKPPLVWIRDEVPDDGEPRYVQCDLNGISVDVPHQDWGVLLSPRINHLLAYNHWESAEADSSDTEARFDYETLIATIAIEGDQRLVLGYDVPDNLKAGDGTTMDVVDNDAEMWVLLPNTIVDLDEDGGIVNSPDETIVLRNDSSRLALLLAGLYMRYINERVRATITIRGFLPWGDLVGHILATVQQGSSQEGVGAPITSIEWVAGDSPKMVIKTGYA